jgi:hypothetical protein
MARQTKRMTAPKVSTRKGSLAPEATVITEVTGERGNGLLISISAPRDGRNVYISPYRADPGVFLEIRTHAKDCALGGYGTSERTRDVNAEVCDCGACLVYDAVTFSWKPTERRVFFGTQKPSPNV